VSAYLYWYLVTDTGDLFTSYPELAFYRGHLIDITRLPTAIHTSIGMYSLASCPIMWKMIGPKRDLKDLATSGWAQQANGKTPPRSLQINNYKLIKPEIDRYRFERVHGGPR